MPLVVAVAALAIAAAFVGRLVPWLWGTIASQPAWPGGRA